MQIRMQDSAVKLIQMRAKRNKEDSDSCICLYMSEMINAK